ncbi:MAG: carbohydrate ABC transporter permease [Deltaproteobacteria bacterium]|nr:carbohydrate ABC transporter permease [Deltaproteobacteria bacterium]
MEARVGETFYKRVWIFYLPLLLFLVLLLFPFYWMLIASIKPDRELYDLTANPFIVRKVTFAHWWYLLSETLFPRWMVNTLIVAVASTALSLFCGVLAGYSLSRLKFPGSATIGVSIFITYLVPPSLLFIPLADVIKNLHLLDSPLALILSYPTILVPFSTWLLMGYFKTIPRELEECARIDGATRFQAFYRIILPLATPGILSAGIFSFTLSWNEYLFALVFLSSPDNKTVPVGVVSELIKGDVFFWGSLMAGALLGSIPVAVIYSFFVEYYVSGLTGGAVKG